MKTYYYSASIKRPAFVNGEILIDGSISSKLKGLELAEEIKKKIRFDFKLDLCDNIVILNVM